jgi:hypothetical protein
VNVLIVPPTPLSRSAIAQITKCKDGYGSKRQASCGSGTSVRFLSGFFPSKYINLYFLFRVHFILFATGWFSLVGDQLYYFQGPGLEACTRSISLSSIVAAVWCPFDLKNLPKDKLTLCFELVTLKRHYVLKAKTEELARKWVKSIECAREQLFAQGIIRQHGYAIKLISNSFFHNFCTIFANS